MRVFVFQGGLPASVNSYTFLLSHILNLLNNKIILFSVTGEYKIASRLLVIK